MIPNKWKKEAPISNTSNFFLPSDIKYLICKKAETQTKQQVCQKTRY